MPNYDEPQYTARPQGVGERGATRLENDIERIRIVTRRLSTQRQIFISHTDKLGYYAHPVPLAINPASVTTQPSCLIDAISELELEAEAFVNAMVVLS